jgi:hypothetical protein
VKRMYLGWIIILALVVVGMIAVVLSPKWRGDPMKLRLEQQAKKAMAEGPPAEPGQGQLTGNLERAKRYDMPIVAIFSEHKHEHLSEPEQVREHEEDRARHEALNKLAAQYDQVAAILEVQAANAPASVVRAGVTEFPTTIIYGADHNVLWRGDGKELTADQIRAELAKLGIKPRQAS